MTQSLASPAGGLERLRLEEELSRHLSAKQVVVEAGTRVIFRK